MDRGWRDAAGQGEPLRPLLDVRGLDVHFGAQHAVQALDLQIRAGETLALVGESGCGKSTTALAILRLLSPRARLAGSIQFEGRNLLALRERELAQVRGNAISIIFQEPMTSLNPVLSIGAQVVEAITLHQPLSRQAAKARALALLELVRLPQPGQRFDDYPHQLSGGQRQRVMIAMAVASKPKLLIADEPTTALDVTIQAQILQLIDDLRRELGMAVLLITHDLGVVAQWADRVAVMYGGQKLEEGPAAQVFTHPASTYTQGLLGASLHGNQGIHYRTARLAEIRHHADGAFELQRPPVREAADAPRLPEPAPGKPLLEVENLQISYPSAGAVVQAVRGVSFAIARGETLGLVGESGCGKSSLSRAIVRLAQAQAGRVRFDGADLLPLSRRALLPWRRRVQMIFQDPYSSLNPRQRIEDILGHALAIHGVKDRAERARRITAILDDVGLPAAARLRYPHEFSGGQRQRIGIARALVLRPELVICDEPVSALDVSVQAQILNLLVDLKDAYGLAYLFISHDLAVVRYIADRVLVMHAGQIVEAGNVEQVWQQPQHPYTRTLLAAAPGHGAGLATTETPLAQQRFG
ncbi:ABC transporter ATP-binding protein [Corticibacter populi]|uniref:ABC transporter ATP-binding protein n=1 Tax=Corticibacter populi TaxID=1550736 RepID=A0A3M6QXG3_9BURK|nr:ABC transporter ATP-binding protein [Corticibacter populi]RMX07707.1 ABC transporter ATP-binding protein [Corticibacter populi]RZS30222.1 peptide/nickel transport system ATP-binding protein [Corticibacter populi]